MDRFWDNYKRYDTNVIGALEREERMDKKKYLK